MRREALAQVYIRDGQGWSCATAYAIRPALVLTVQHAFPDCVGERRGTGGEISVQVRFWQKQELVAGKRIWVARPPYDAALIRLETERADLGDTAFGELTIDPVAWTGHGFPYAELRTSPEGSRQDSAPLSGRVALKESGLVQGTIDGHVTEPELWQGISGSPVFVEQSLVAIVQSTNPAFDGRRVDGTPLAELMKDTDFRRLVTEYASISEYLLVVLGCEELCPPSLALPEAVLGRLATTLDQQSRACKNLARVLKCDPDADAVAKALVDRGAAQTVQGVAGWIEELSIPREAAQALVNDLLTLANDEDHLKRLRGTPRARRSARASDPADRPLAFRELEMLEVVLAGLLSRACHFLVAEGSLHAEALIRPAECGTQKEALLNAVLDILAAQPGYDGIPRRGDRVARTCEVLCREMQGRTPRYVLVQDMAWATVEEELRPLKPRLLASVRRAGAGEPSHLPQEGTLQQCLWQVHLGGQGERR